MIIVISCLKSNEMHAKHLAADLSSLRCIKLLTKHTLDPYLLLEANQDPIDSGLTLSEVDRPLQELLK